MGRPSGREAWWSGGVLGAAGERAHAFLKALAESPTQSQAVLGHEDDLIFSFVRKLQASNSIDVHDDRAVNADELGVAQVPLEVLESSTDDVRVPTDVQAGVVVRRLDPIDVRDLREQRLTSALDDQALGRQW